MKIGILTQPLHNNYGGLLQNYALQQVLLRMGHSVETIDQQIPNISIFHDALFQLKMRVFHFLNPRKYSIPRYQPNENEVCIIRKNTNAFIEKYIRRSPIVNSTRDFSRVSRQRGYDAFLVGSDQCWRPCYNMFLRSMFLDFVMDRKDVKRVSYAASFGSDDWEFTQEQTKECANLAKQFDLITVREKSGIKLCKQYLNVDAFHVLDPTMLLTKDDYINIVEDKHEPSHEGIFFEYILDPSDQKTNFINKLSKELGTVSFQVLPKCQAETRTRRDIKSRIEDCIYPGVESWLRAFMDAEMTVVDSFHGVVFSILFNKPFWVIGNKKRGLTRFVSLLELFGLEDRLVDSIELVSLEMKKEIDWTKVNDILISKRKDCLTLLSNAFI